MRITRRIGYHPVVALMLGLLLGHPASAALKSTETVRGRAPTVSDVAIVATTGNPMEGDTLQSSGSQLFTDVDGDAEFNSLKQWYRSGDTTPVASGTSYRLTASDVGQTLQFGYTPATDPAITDPAIGVEVRSTASAGVQGLPVAASSTFAVSKASVIANNSDTTVLTLTLKDSGNRPVTGIAIRLSLEASVVSGFSGGAPALPQPLETAQGSGIYTATVKSGSVGTINVTPKLNAGPLSVTPGSQQIAFVSPLSVTQVSPVVNAYSFGSGSGFPTTGFATAKFRVSLSDNNPTAYQWAVDGSNNGTGYTSVDTTGVVTLNTARSGAQLIQVKDKISGAVLASYSFTLTGWFTNNGSTKTSWTAANTYCSTRGGQPTVAQLTNAEYRGGAYAPGGTRSVGNLWGEWGDIGAQGSGFIKDDAELYWASEGDGRGYYYVIYMNSGFISLHLNIIDSAIDGKYVVCRQGL
ncbi:invasin domain 3-containing protein [Edwardsiella tarda]|uniref:invasin domain 3-containing protein n=1 Tax=Edwardsiella tarda TaxID=636 RepID=UPI003081AAB1|nr:invasin domain 3-containing protein [Edwardsiella tarda]